MKKLILFIAYMAIAIFAVSITGCKDKCQPCGDSYKTIPQEMRDWALFEEGSWWVYRLAEDTTVFDTVRFSSKSDFRSNKWTCHDNNSLSIPCSETITYKLQHSNTNYFPHHADTTIGGFDEIVLYYPPGGGVCMHYSNSAGSVTNGRLLCIEPIIIGERYGSFTLIDTFSNQIFNNLSVKKGFYSDKTTSTLPPPNSFQSVYWGKNIGLLKIQITHSNGETKNWELINYEIKQ